MPDLTAEQRAKGEAFARGSEGEPYKWGGLPHWNRVDPSLPDDHNPDA